MSGLSLSFLNLAEATTLTASTTFTEAETGVGLRFPTRPHLRGYSPDLSAHRITLDFGIATALEVIALIHANFTAATIQGHATDSWGAPSYSQAITLARAKNRRYHHAYRPAITTPAQAFSYRYLSISVPTQSTTDAAVRFALGGIWAGLITAAPRNVLMGPKDGPVDVMMDVKTEDGRKIQRVTFDDPAWRLVAKRQAENEAELDAWDAIDRQWADAPSQAALVMLRDTVPAWVYVARREPQSEPGEHAPLWSETDLVLDEVTAG